MVLSSRVRQTELKSLLQNFLIWVSYLTSVASAFPLLNGNKKYLPHGATVLTEYGNT